MKMVPSKVYNKNYFEAETAGTQEWKKYKGKVLEPRLEYAYRIARVKSNDLILDYGCGRGELTLAAVKNTNAKVIAIDYASSAIKLTKKCLSILPKRKLRNVSVRLLADKKLPLENESIDCIFFIDVIEHLYDSELKVLFKEFYRILKPGGKIILHTPNKDFLEKGYPNYTRYWNRLINTILYPRVIKDRVIDREDPRNEVDKIVHINEQNKNSILKWFPESKYRVKLWFNDVSTPKPFISIFSAVLSRPTLIPILKKYFSWEIWAIIYKI